jgi:hypothetical protein
MARHNHGIHVDRFDTGLIDLKRKEQRDPALVLNHLAQSGEFSNFEATDNQTIARTVQRLIDNGYMIATPKAYPWTEVKLTTKGSKFLEDNGYFGLGGVNG